MNILVFYGSVRHHRKGIRAARFVVNKLKEREHDVDLIDPVEYDFGLLDKMYKEYKEGKAPEKMEQLAGMIKNADGFVIVTGEYNHSIPPALTNMMDHFLEEYLFRPSAIVSYSAGRFGGVHAAMQQRAFLSEIGTLSISSIFPIPQVGKNLDEDGNLLDENFNKYISRFLDEFEWYVKVLKDGRANYGTPF